jgi:death-on-curing protein
MSTEPNWLSRLVVDTIHAELLQEHGGVSGIRDEDLIESALARPLQRYHYEPSSDLPTLAAAYLFGLVKNHPYVDGNKRVGFAAAAVFLLLNGLELTAPEVDAYDAVIGTASGTLSETDLASWLRRHAQTARP